MNVEIKGVITLLGPVEEVGAKKYPKRTIWIDEQVDNYPNKYEISFFNKNADKLEGFTEGQEVTVSCNLRGYEWERDGNKNRGTSLDGWKIVETKDDATGVTFSAEPDEDELPF